MLIDKQEYEKVGEVKCVHGSGDNKEEWSFEALRAPSDQIVLYNSDKGRSYLYLPLKRNMGDAQIDETYETCPVDTVRSPGEVGIHRDNTEICWVRLSERFSDVPKPFKGTSDGMTIGRGADADLYLSVPVVELRTGEYYTARFPAREQPAPTVQEHVPSPLARPVELVTAMALLALLGSTLLTGSLLPLSAFWWGSLVAALLYAFASPGHAFHDALRLWTGSFFVFFSTHFLDTMIAGEVWDQPLAFKFEAFHAAAIVLALLILRYTWLRGYCILADAGWKGGGCSCLLFGAGLAFWSMMEEFSYFPWIRWYSGATPWGFLWLVGLCLMLYDRFQDYRQTPLLYPDFVADLSRLHRILSSGIDASVAHEKELARLCDDMEDAVRMSFDHPVAALRELGDSFLKLKAACEVLKYADEVPKQDQWLLREDLETISGDLKEILDQSGKWGRGATIKKLRVSSFLTTYNW